MSCAWFLPPHPTPARSKSPGWLAVDAAAWHAKQWFDGKLRLHNVLIGLNFEIIDATLHLSIANVNATQGLKAQCSLWHMKWLSSRLWCALHKILSLLSPVDPSLHLRWIKHIQDHLVRVCEVAVTIDEESFRSWWLILPTIWLWMCWVNLGGTENIANKYFIYKNWFRQSILIGQVLFHDYNSTGTSTFM